MEDIYTKKDGKCVKLLSIEEAKERLKMSRSNLNYYILTGRVKAIPVNAKWLIPEDEVERFRKSYRKRCGK